MARSLSPLNYEEFFFTLSDACAQSQEPLRIMCRTEAEARSLRNKTYCFIRACENYAKTFMAPKMKASGLPSKYRKEAAGQIDPEAYKSWMNKAAALRGREITLELGDVRCFVVFTDRNSNPKYIDFETQIRGQVEVKSSFERALEREDLQVPDTSGSLDVFYKISEGKEPDLSSLLRPASPEDDDDEK